ncbi:MAG TPA: class I SAM-dependent methyltransferase [Pyrinomonadaceae bacterium]|nr:class I SAM-dependent methyltransferase [Pyrinomonadaceae bacterium]
MGATQSNSTLREWSESARYWEKHAATLRAIFAPATTALIKAAGIVTGQSILDVAAGTGDPSLTIAEVVGPTGSVTCTDAIRDMVRTAEREAQRRHLTNVTVCHCPADALPFPDDTFDAVVSRLGVMFFPEPVNALRELLRVAKPGGFLTLVAWEASELNPFLNVVTAVLSRYVETPAVDPDAPGAFRFAEHGKLAQVLRDAGASEVRERTLSFQIEASLSFEEFWELRAETSATLREKLQTLSENELTRLKNEVEEASREFFTRQGMNFPAQMIVVAGKKRIV